ncbi:hypothetical protein JW948_16995 [bacterium]|nr:hypothetical protein [bacterium]
MMKNIAIVLIALLLCSPFILSAREKVALAVLDFEGKNVEQANAEAVTDLLRTELFNTGSFRVIERQKIRQIIQEQNFQATGVTSTDKAVEIGRILNVQKIMVGTVTRLGSTYIINTRIVDVQSGAVVLAEAIERRGGEEELPKAIAELATTISFKVGLEGSIIRVGNDEIFMDLGQADGIRLGQKFDVIRLGEVITDLEGRIIGTTNDVIGMIFTTKIQDRFSVASVLKEDSPFRKGDIVRPSQDQEAVPDPPKKTQEVKKTQPPVKKEPKKEDNGDLPSDIPPIF